MRHLFPQGQPYNENSFEPPIKRHAVYNSRCLFKRFLLYFFEFMINNSFCCVIHVNRTECRVKEERSARTGTYALYEMVTFSVTVIVLIFAALYYCCHLRIHSSIYSLFYQPTHTHIHSPIHLLKKYDLKFTETFFTYNFI